MRPTLLAFFCLALAAQNRTLDKEAERGRQLAEIVRRQTSPVESQEVQEYTEHLGAKLAAQLPGAFPYTFSVVDTHRTSATEEPLALPGGYIFVPLNLLLAAKDEAEFAGVLAQSMVRELLLTKRNAAESIPVFFSSNPAGGLVLPTALTHELRQWEHQADASAASAMSRAGFDPEALLRYLGRALPSDRRDAARLATLRKTIRALRPAAYTESDKFQSMQEKARPVAPAPAKQAASICWARPSLALGKSIPCAETLK